MRHLALLVVVAAVAAALAGAQAAYPDRGHGRGKGQPVVFVQTNELDGNHIVVYDRAPNGALSRAGTFATGGNGGAAAPGDVSDRLASQGSLVFDSRHSLLLAVNAGSDTVSTFKVRGNRLQLKGVVGSGGQFPASIAVHGDLVYVMNAGNTGVVQGFRIRGHRLRPVAGSARSLGLANGNPPNFLTSPGQVGFTPGGRKLIVTTKASDSHILVFRVRRDGTLSAAPVVNDSATPVPFAFTFSPQGRLVVNILASISEFERELIHARMTEGRTRAKAKGVKFVPKFKLSPYQRQEALARLQAGETLKDVAKTYGVDTSTIWRLQRGASS